jgi:hypothetical protein
MSPKRNIYLLRDLYKHLALYKTQWRVSKNFIIDQSEYKERMEFCIEGVFSVECLANILDN